MLPSFFAEYHRNIRTIHLTIRLPSLPSDLTTCEIYDRKTLRVRHGFLTQSVALPASIDVKAELQLNHSGKQITCRIPATSIAVDSDVNEVPFSSIEDLNAVIACVDCNSIICKGANMTWRLLPSEHWTETMDSWHCHRGLTTTHDSRTHTHTEHHDQYALPDHIVSATRNITASPGVGFIGLSYLLLHASDTTVSLAWSSRGRAGMETSYKNEKTEHKSVLSATSGRKKRASMQSLCLMTLIQSS